MSGIPYGLIQEIFDVVQCSFISKGMDDDLVEIESQNQSLNSSNDDGMNE